MKSIKAAAHQAVKEICADISDRQGLGDEFDLIDQGTKEGMLDTWQYIIERCFED